MKQLRSELTRTGTASRSRDLIAFATIALATVAMVAAAGCGGGGGAPPANQAAALEGKGTYDRVCATCHGKDANGLPKLGKGLRDNEWTQSQSDAELVTFLKSGRPSTHPLNTTGVDMPPKGGDPTITEADLENVVAYLRTL